ncbi:hypothetical protein V501_08982 [Pseudogymnoascus sp. VKM F-4519 (FW-2642)]|nr:hypothetical protein V501_08982 [Pseudogymnoascus sp. VKM F-4519 (FW-2642)]
MEPSKSNIPDLQLQSLAVDFIDNRLDKYHPAFSTPPARYDPARGSFMPVLTSRPETTMQSQQQQQQPSTTPRADDVQLIPRPRAEPAKALKFWDSLFVRAMNKFTAGPDAAKEPGGRAEAGYSIRDKKDWTAVFDTLQEAKQCYFERKGIKGTFRRVYRSIADFGAPVLLDVTKLVPETGCLFVTPVVGSIQIVLEAVKKAAEVRKAMDGAFDNIDMKFQDIELFLQTFPDDDNIDEASIDLIVAAFAAIESVIGFLIQSILKRIGGSILKRGDYEKEALDTLETVQSKSNLLNSQANNSEKWMVRQGFQAVFKETGHIKDMFLRAYEDRAVYLGIISTLSRPVSPNPPPYDSTVEPEQFIGPQELLDWIGVPDAASEDRKLINERWQMRVPLNEQAQAEQLIRSTQFKDWVVAGTSSQLLVHGEYDGQRYVSGLSLFCSSFAQSLEARAPRFIPLIFFCGLHTDPDTDRHTGGRAIIQNFICQLLCQFDFDTRSFAIEKLDEHLIQLGDIGELSRLFEWLVGKLPQSVVLFCLIDGVGYYEREEFEHDIGFVVEKLLRISAEKKTQAGVKILLTSSSRTTYIRQPFPDELVLSIESLARANMVPSKSRLERQLNESQPM